MSRSRSRVTSKSSRRVMSKRGSGGLGEEKGRDEEQEG